MFRKILALAYAGCIEFRSWLKDSWIVTSQVREPPAAPFSPYPASTLPGRSVTMSHPRSKGSELYRML